MTSVFTAVVESNTCKNSAVLREYDAKREEYDQTNSHPEKPLGIYQLAMEEMTIHDQFIYDYI